MSSDSSPKNTHFCEECEEMRPTYHQCRNQLNMEYNFKCKHCPEAFRWKSGLKIHLNRDHPIPKPFKCDQCGKRFSKKFKRRLHIKARHIQKGTGNSKMPSSSLKLNKSEAQATCKETGNTFNKSSSLNKATLHKDPKPKQSEEHATIKENSPNRSNKDLKQATCKENVNTAQPFNCKHCKKGFRLKYILIKHIKQSHRSHCVKCKQCDQLFVQNGHHKSSLERHNRSVHWNEKFDCPQCEETFSQKSCVKRHIKIKHSKEKDFDCEHCASTFNRKDNLIKHVRDVHCGVQ